MKAWEKIVPDEDRVIYDNAGFGKRQSFGKRPALMVIDVVESFTGSKPQSVLEAQSEYALSCGESSWEALPKIKSLISLSRNADIPIVYTKANAYERSFCGGSTKLEVDDIQFIRTSHTTPIAKMVEPEDKDFVLEKTKASAFFDTVLDSYLKRLKIDTLLVCGTSTSGCVRATVVDGFSYGYKVFVVEDCCFDRSGFYHLASLYDLNAKYATVVALAEAEDYIKTLEAGN
jgi:nicotinamidase-related amidase